ncbi:MAG: putative sensor protein [Thermoleophilia bacterium]|nr:putative sensor protein [Thermoleophilia bacterium]
MPYFICPSCAWRGARTSRTAGFTDRPAACERCGFGFLFELLDDYFPSPLAGIFVCDQQGRILAFGRGARELSGFDEQELMGSDLADALELRVPDEPDAQAPHLTALEWGARVLGKQMTLHDAAGKDLPVTGDFFPAYDDDGGLLASFTPRSAPPTT